MTERNSKIPSRNQGLYFKRIIRLCGGHFRYHSVGLRVQLALMFAIDLAIVGFFLAGPYLHNQTSYAVINYAIVLWITAELAAKWAVAPSPRRFLLEPLNWLDLVVVGTLVFPQYLANFAFLRVARLWSIVQRPVFALLMRCQVRGGTRIARRAALSQGTGLRARVGGQSPFTKSGAKGRALGFLSINLSAPHR